MSVDLHPGRCDSCRECPECGRPICHMRDDNEHGPEVLGVETLSPCDYREATDAERADPITAVLDRFCPDCFPKVLAEFARGLRAEVHAEDCCCSECDPPVPEHGEQDRFDAGEGF